MRNPFNAFLFLLSMITVSSCNEYKNGNESDKNVEIDREHILIAYVAGYRDFDFSTIDVANLTHINYAFANIDDGAVVFDTSKIDGKNLTPKDIEALIRLKDKNPDLQVLVSVGGWSWSKGFSDAALTESSRSKFARSCAEFVDLYNLDGIDLDWEYPNQVGAGNTYRPEDVQNFTLLLKEVRKELDQLTKNRKNEKHYLLTIATGADKAFVENTVLSEVSKHIDFLNIMTYDFYNGLHKTTGHHSNLHSSTQPDLDMNSVVNSVDMHLKAGFPVRKINLGIPFYGRIWKGVKNDGDNILFQDAETAGYGIDYKDLSKNINTNGYIRYWDDAAKAPYLWNEQEKVFISYEDEESIELKIHYLKEKGLSGVMFWEYCADRDQQLLDCIVKHLF